MTVVKICGLRRYEDAQAAANAGADLLSFTFYPGSKRYIAPEAAAGVIAALRAENGPLPYVCGLFVNAGPRLIAQTVARCGLDCVHLAGDEPPEAIVQLPISPPILKTFRPLPGETAADLHARFLPYFRAARPLTGRESIFEQPLVPLLDAAVPGHYGGTGQIGDWQLAAKYLALSAQHSALSLAGGLTPENVGAAVRQVRPWGVDVASGVESAPGIKDHDKIRAFIAAARAADADTNTDATEMVGHGRA